jgi:hypothetical protein
MICFFQIFFLKNEAGIMEKRFNPLSDLIFTLFGCVLFFGGAALYFLKFLSGLWNRNSDDSGD